MPVGKTVGALEMIEAIIGIVFFFQFNVGIGPVCAHLD